MRTPSAKPLAGQNTAICSGLDDKLKTQPDGAKIRAREDAGKESHQGVEREPSSLSRWGPGHVA
jgi:hypothetical protein